MQIHSGTASSSSRIALTAMFLPLCFLLRSAHADAPRIACVDLKLVYSNLQETIDTQHDLTELQKQLDAMVKAHQAEMNPPDAKPIPIADIDAHDAKELDFNLQEQTLKLKIVRKQCHQLAKAWADMHDAIDGMGKARHLDLVIAGGNPPLPLGVSDAPMSIVLDSSYPQRVAQMILARDFVYTDVDITADVIAAVNKNYKSTAAPLPALPTTTIKIGPANFQLEIAADEPSREHGLMERDILPANHGMIFVFPTSAYRNFWMHHTRFPLDIVFADEHGKVVSTAMMKAYDETGIPSDGPAKYAIELPTGTTATVKPGDTLSIPPAVDAALKK